MTLEVVASRIIAPYLGVSLYTWTSVIATVLLGVTLGNYAGGRIADTRLSRKGLGACLALGGIAALLAMVSSIFLGPAVSHLAIPLWMMTLLFCLLVFFPTAFFLSTISPQVVKFDLRSMEHAGVTIGTIGAWSAIGSIVGTFASGYVFILYFGTKLIMVGLGVLLLALGTAVAWAEKLWKHEASGVAALLLLGNVMIPSVCQMETNYYCLRVKTTSLPFGTQYHLVLDHLVHSSLVPDFPDAFGYDYEWVQARVLAYAHLSEDIFSTLTIGGGGYSMPRYIEAVYPNARIDVVEIDPGVTVFNHEKFGLSTSTRINTMNMDARLFLEQLPASSTYDAIFMDAVNDYSPPFQLTTQEFQALVRAHLSPKGTYAVTVIDDPAHGEFTAAMVKTLRTVFPQVYLFPMGSELDGGAGRNTFEIVALNEPLDLQWWAGAEPLRTFSDEDVGLDPTRWLKASEFLPEDKLAQFLAAHPVPVLTDDHAPTDAYLAPLFADAYRERVKVASAVTSTLPGRLDLLDP